MYSFINYIFILIIIILLLILYSIYIYIQFKKSINFNEKIPSWFDKSLIKEFKEKRNNETIKFFNNKFYHYKLLLIYKLYCLITNSNLIYYSSWNNIENIINNIKIQNKYDIVIGIKSGGAYIANYVAKINDIPNVGYIKIKKIKQENENNGIYARFNQSIYNKMYKLKSFYSPIDLKNKRVLIVDDGLLSGKTFEQVKKYIKTKKPKTISLFLLEGYSKTIDKIKKKNNIYYNKINTYYYFGPWGQI